MLSDEIIEIYEGRIVAGEKSDYEMDLKTKAVNSYIRD